jgi:AbrB family looped-hinge helix DNA binding protein
MTLRLSTKGQLVIPADLRKALNLKAGDRITVTLEGQSLVLQRATRPAAKLKRGRFARPVLMAPSGAPAMTTERVNALLEELP